jgi:D-alanyl-D-alanine dipeptidase
MTSREGGSKADVDETSRISYWRESMEQGYRFMRRMMEYPVVESREPLVSIETAAAHAGVEVQFSLTPIVDEVPRIFEVREGLIEPLLAAAREMNERGWVMRIEDAFRTAEMQRGLALKPSVFDLILERAARETGNAEPELEVVQRRVATLVANWPKVAGHMSGCAVDIAVFQRDARTELNRGGPYLEMSELTPMWSPFVSMQALHNRAEITAIMERHGFAAYPSEFWHYSQGDVFAEHLRCTGNPARYAAVSRDERTGAIEPVANLTQPLNTPTTILEQITQAKRRLRLRTPVRFSESHST